MRKVVKVLYYNLPKRDIGNSQGVYRKTLYTHALWSTTKGLKPPVNVVELDSVMEVSLMISDQKITNLDPYQRIKLV